MEQLDIITYLEEKPQPEPEQQHKEIHGLRYSEEEVEGWIKVNEIRLKEEHNLNEKVIANNVWVNPEDLTNVITNKHYGQILAHTWAFRLKENVPIWDFAIYVEFADPDDYDRVKELFPERCGVA